MTEEVNNQDQIIDVCNQYTVLYDEAVSLLDQYSKLEMSNELLEVSTNLIKNSIKLHNLLMPQFNLFNDSIKFSITQLGEDLQALPKTEKDATADLDATLDKYSKVIGDLICVYNNVSKCGEEAKEDGHTA